MKCIMSVSVVLICDSNLFWEVLELSGEAELKSFQSQTESGSAEDSLVQL